jgi:peroxiredoxin
MPDSLTRRRFLTHTGVAILVGGVAITLGPRAASAAVQAKVGEPAPAFTATATNGSPVSLASYKGKIVVLEWTNHECPYVRKHYETGNMQALQREATAQGVVWLTLISSAKGEQGNVTAAQADELTTSRKAAPTAVLLDEPGAVGRMYGATNTPCTWWTRRARSSTRAPSTTGPPPGAPTCRARATTCARPSTRSARVSR